MKPMKRGACFALAASLCLAALPLAAQNRTGLGNSKGGGLTTSSSSGRSSSSSKAAGKKGIFDLATSSDSGAKSGSAAPAAGRTSTTTSPFGTTSPGTSPFGTTSPRTTKASSARRWKTTSKIADCIREKAIPANTNLSFSATITNIISDDRYTILTMFDSVSVTTESGETADVPVTFTVVLDAGLSGNAKLKEGTKKSFTVDSNYVYLVWNDSGCTVRAVDNSLTDQELGTPDTIRRENNNRTNRDKTEDIQF